MWECYTSRSNHATREVTTLDASQILDKLVSPKQQSKNVWVAKCPSHEDREPSLTVTETCDRLLVHCHAGCDIRDILKSLDISYKDLFFDSGESSSKNTPFIIDEYEYRDIESRLVYVVERCIPKSFRQRRPLPNGEWVWNLENTPRLIYRLPQVVKAIQEGRWVFIVEGEKDVHTLETMGFVATTTSGGASAWKPEHAEWFGNAKVAIVPDNDEAGMRYAENVAASVSQYAADVRIVHLPDLQPKGDVTDYFLGYGTVEEFKDLILTAPVWTPGPVVQLGHVQRQELTWTWKNRIPQNKLTIVAGTQGKGKSYLCLSVLAALSTGKSLPGTEPCEPQESLYITFEDDPADTLRPRAEKLGADLSRIHIWDGRLHPFKVPDNLEVLKAVLRARPNISTIVIDPVVSALGPIDSYRESEVRTSLGYILGLGKTVIGIMHLTKSERDQVVYRVAGSSGFTALARSVLMVDGGTVRVVKSNVAPLGQITPFSIDQRGFHWGGE